MGAIRVACLPLKASMCAQCLSASSQLRRPRLTSNRGYPIPQASRLEPQTLRTTPVAPLQACHPPLFVECCLLVPPR